MHLARATAVYIYIILKFPQLSWYFPLPGRRNFVLVHPSSSQLAAWPLDPHSRGHSDNCRGTPTQETTLLDTHTHSVCPPCANSSIRTFTLCAHSSIRTPTLCAHSRRYSEICRVPTQVYAHPLCANLSIRTPTLCAYSTICTPTLCATQEGILKFAVCPHKYTHTHSVCPLCANSSTCTPTLYAHSSIRTPTLCANSVPTQVYSHPLCVPTQEGILIIDVELLPDTHVHSRRPTQETTPLVVWRPFHQAHSSPHLRDDTASRVEAFSFHLCNCRNLYSGHQPSCFHSHNHC